MPEPGATSGTGGPEPGAPTPTRPPPPTIEEEVARIEALLEMTPYLNTEKAVVDENLDVYATSMIPAIKGFISACESLLDVLSKHKTLKDEKKKMKKTLSKAKDMLKSAEKHIGKLSKLKPSSTPPTPTPPTPAPTPEPTVVKTEEELAKEMIKLLGKEAKDIAHLMKRMAYIRDTDKERAGFFTDAKKRLGELVDILENKKKVDAGGKVSFEDEDKKAMEEHVGAIIKIFKTEGFFNLVERIKKGWVIREGKSFTKHEDEFSHKFDELEKLELKGEPKVVKAFTKKLEGLKDEVKKIFKLIHTHVTALLETNTKIMDTEKVEGKSVKGYLGRVKDIKQDKTLSEYVKIIKKFMLDFDGIGNLIRESNDKAAASLNACSKAIVKINNLKIGVIKLDKHFEVEVLEIKKAKKAAKKKAAPKKKTTKTK